MWPYWQSSKMTDGRWGMLACYKISYLGIGQWAVISIWPMTAMIMIHTIFPSFVAISEIWLVLCRTIFLLSVSKRGYQTKNADGGSVGQRFFLEQQKCWIFSRTRASVNATLFTCVYTRNRQPHKTSNRTFLSFWSSLHLPWSSLFFIMAVTLSWCYDFQDDFVNTMT